MRQLVPLGIIQLGGLIFRLISKGASLQRGLPLGVSLLKRLLALLADFPSAPFTVQRLCEVRRLRHSLTRMTGHAGRRTLISPHIRF